MTGVDSQIEMFCNRTTCIKLNLVLFNYFTLDSVDPKQNHWQELCSFDSKLKLINVYLTLFIIPRTSSHHPLIYIYLGALINVWSSVLCQKQIQDKMTKAEGKWLKRKIFPHIMCYGTVAICIDCL